jgi:hypothetical protein
LHHHLEKYIRAHQTCYHYLCRKMSGSCSSSQELQGETDQQ